MRIVTAALAAFRAAIGPRELGLLIGLGLLAFGLAQIYAPAAFLAPGAILVYVAIAGLR